MQKILIFILCTAFWLVNTTFAAEQGHTNSSKPQSLRTADVSKILDTAINYKGVPYLYGGSTPKGFDCSGLVQYVFAKNNIKLPRTADAQFAVAQPVSNKTIDYTALKPGDLVFFDTEKINVKPDKEVAPRMLAKSDKSNDKIQINHVGIYMGNRQFIDAETTKGVTVSSLEDAYWRTRFVTAGRIVEDSGHTKGLLEYLLALFE